MKSCRHISISWSDGTKSLPAGPTAGSALGQSWVSRPQPTPPGTGQGPALEQGSWPTPVPSFRNSSGREAAKAMVGVSGRGLLSLALLHAGAQSWPSCSCVTPSCRFSFTTSSLGQSLARRLMGAFPAFPCLLSGAYWEPSD